MNFIRNFTVCFIATQLGSSAPSPYGSKHTQCYITVCSVGYGIDIRSTFYCRHIDSSCLHHQTCASTSLSVFSLLLSHNWFLKEYLHLSVTCLQYKDHALFIANTHFGVFRHRVFVPSYLEESCPWGRSQLLICLRARGDGITRKPNSLLTKKKTRRILMLEIEGLRMRVMKMKGVGGGRREVGQIILHCLRPIL